MNRTKKVLLIVGIVLLVVAIAAAVTYHVVRRPARSVYLLPDGNVMAYVNFTPFRFLNTGSKPISTDPQDQEFVDQTGFRVDHDLDNVAVSGRVVDEANADMAAIATGTFDQQRLTSYIQKQPGIQSETYSGKTVFSVQQKDQTVRFCILDGTTVAATVGPTPLSLHAIIDRFGTSGATPQLLNDYYDNVPFGSVAWAIVKVPDVPSGAPGPGGLNFDFLKNGVMIMSARYTGSVRFRVEFIAQNDKDATQVFQAVNGFVAFGRSAAKGQRNDPDVSEVMDNIQVQQSGSHVSINVVVPQDVLQRAAAKR